MLWRFTGSRTLSPNAEHRARRAIAVSFWLLAPYLVIHVAHDLDVGHRAAPTVLGIVVTAFSLVSMPVAGAAKRRLGRRLGLRPRPPERPPRTSCARAMAAGVLTGLWLNTHRMVVGRSGDGGGAGRSRREEGTRAWHGHACCH